MRFQVDLLSGPAWSADGREAVDVATQTETIMEDNAVQTEEKALRREEKTFTESPSNRLRSPPLHRVALTYKIITIYCKSNLPLSIPKGTGGTTVPS